MAFPTDWQRRVAITIDNTKVAGSGTLSNFPVLLTLDNLPTEMVDAGSNSAQDGGGDIRFSSDSAGSTQLACEIVDFHPDATAGNRRAEIWVKVASLSGSSDTIIYAWYKPTSIKQQPAPSSTYGRESVWTTDYKAVHHMGDGERPDMSGLWLVRPRSAEYNGATYVAFLDYNNTAIKCAKYTHSTGVWTAAVTVATAPQQDAHCAPSILIDDQGKINVFYGSYNAGTVAARVVRSTNAEDVSAWGSPVSISTTTAQPTYVTAVQLSTTEFIAFWRLGTLGSTTMKIVRKVSTDRGATWSNQQDIFSGTTTKRPYFAVTLGASDRVHLAYHIQDNTGSLHRDLFYLYTDDAEAATSSWAAIDGTAITLPIGDPTTVAGGQVYDSGTPFPEGCYLMGLAVDGSNNPQILAQLAISAGTDEVSAFEYSGSAWNKRQVLSSDETEVGAIEYRGEGDIRFVSGTTWRALIQRNVSSRWEVQEYETTDGTSWSQKRVLTSSSTLHNTQPQFVRSMTGPIEAVWWSCQHSITQASESYNGGHDLWFSGSHNDNGASHAIGAWAASTAWLRDSTQYHNHGTKKGAAEPTETTTSAFGTSKAQNFDGVNDYVTLGNDSSMNITGNISVSAWVNPDDNAPAGSEAIVVRWGAPSGTNDSWILWRLVTTEYAQFYVRDSAGTAWYTAENAASVPEATWSRVKGVYDSSNVAVRMGTTEGGTKPAYTGTIRSNTIATVLGQDNALVNASVFDGEMDEVRIAARADSADWSDTEYNNESSPSTFASAGTAGSTDTSGAGASAGSAIVSGVGNAIIRVVGSTAGVATVSGVGNSTVQSVGASTGVTTVNGVGSAIIQAVGSAAGVATVAGVGTTLGSDPVGSSSGVAGVSGVGGSIVQALGTATGVATVDGVGSSLITSVGVSNGTSNVVGISDDGEEDEIYSALEATVVSISKFSADIVSLPRFSGTSTSLARFTVDRIYSEAA